MIIVAADSEERPDGTRVRWLPGSLPNVISVIADWDCPRDTFRIAGSGGEGGDGDGADGHGRTIFLASPYPRPVPGVPPSRNLKGISFAVANMTGFVARVLESSPGASIDRVKQLLREQVRPHTPGDSDTARE